MMKIRFRVRLTAMGAARFAAPLRLLLAAAAVAWIGSAEAQAIDGSVARKATELRFSDFFRNPVGARGLEVSDALRQADGQNVRLVGYMVLQETPTPGRFMLTPRAVQMSEHADGDADDLPPATVVVYLDTSQRDWVVPHERGLVALNGVLHVGRFEERDGRVSWVRLELDPEATRGMGTHELAAYLHGLRHRR